MVWLFLFSFAPAILMSMRHTPSIVWVMPILLAYVFHRQWQWEESSQVEEQEEPPDFFFSPVAKEALAPLSTRERWHTTLLRWRTAVIALPDGVVLLDAQFLVCWFNPAAQGLLGLSEQQNAARSWLRQMNQPILDDYLFNGEFDQPLEIPSPVNGSRMLNMRFVLLEKERLWLLLVRDITEQYQLDRQHRDFMTNISHELKTPLTVFRGLLEILPDLPYPSPQWDRSLVLLQKQTERMHSLIQDQITLLRLGSAHVHIPEMIAMEVFLQDMVDEAKVLSGPLRHVFVLSVDAGFSFNANIELMRCVVGNLLTNAVKHTPQQTEIRVIWEKDKMDQPILTIRDNGPGIASYHLPRLTEKYYRVTFESNVPSNSTDFPGTGLGLALVKESMERCGGQLEIISHPGIGSRFVCRFPHVMVATSSSS